MPCFIAVLFVNIFSPFMCFFSSTFSRHAYFTLFLYGSLASLLYTFKTRSIILILIVTHSEALLNDFLFLFLFPQEFHHWFFASFFFSVLRFVLCSGAVLRWCCVPHYRLLLTRLLFCCFFFFRLCSFRFRVSTFFFLLHLLLGETIYPTTTSTVYAAKHSFKNLYCRPLFFLISRKNVFLSGKSSKTHSSFGVCGNLFLFCAPLFGLHLLDISTAIKETKHHYR